MNPSNQGGGQQPARFVCNCCHGRITTETEKVDRIISILIFGIPNIHHCDYSATVILYLFGIFIRTADRPSLINRAEIYPG